MKQISAVFWVCAEPDEVTQSLRINPTGTRIKQPYSYWDFEVVADASCSDPFYDLLKTLESKEDELLEVTDKFTVGIVVTCEVTKHTDEAMFTVEVEEMDLLSRLKVPVCFSMVMRNEASAVKI
jgi:hypothetical protein